MEQVKVFTDTSKPVQKKVNNWLKENPNIEIIDRLQSSLASRGGSLHTVISIFYREKE